MIYTQYREFYLQFMRGQLPKQLRNRNFGQTSNSLGWLRVAEYRGKIGGNRFCTRRVSSFSWYKRTISVFGFGTVRCLRLYAPFGSKWQVICFLQEFSNAVYTRDTHVFRGGVGVTCRASV